MIKWTIEYEKKIEDTPEPLNELGIIQAYRGPPCQELKALSIFCVCVYTHTYLCVFV